MGQTVGYMREQIRKVYDTMNWRDKVDKMYDDQVIAVYYRMLKTGKIGTIQKIERPHPQGSSKYTQLSIFDLKNK